MTRESKRDLTGERIGYLTVLNKAENIPRADGRGGRSAWNVRCVCGQEKVISKDSLKKMKSCGCKWMDLHKLPEGHGAINHFYSAYKANARARDYCFELPRDYFISLALGSCYYCGSPPAQEIPAAKRYNGTVKVNGVDRVDNSRGYEIDNCVSCCKTCNLMKGQVSVQISTGMLRFIGLKEITDVTNNSRSIH